MKTISENRIGVRIVKAAKLVTTFVSAAILWSAVLTLVSCKSEEDLIWERYCKLHNVDLKNATPEEVEFYLDVWSEGAEYDKVADEIGIYERD